MDGGGQTDALVRDPSRLSGRIFDLLVVGGGILGAGIAWDASQRGLSCALIEQGDFASGTSSKTTKLIHGGIRYLENLDFGLVRESIRERHLLLTTAPHLLQPLPFLIPVSDGNPRPWPIVRAGVILYDLLAGSGRIHKHQFLSGAQISESEPVLSGGAIRKGAVYYDAQMDDARMVLEVLRSAVESGAVAANYVRVSSWILENNRVTGAVAEDCLSGASLNIRARVVINATGPWADRLRRLADASLRPIVRPSKGIHIVYPDVGLHKALLLSSPSDRRIFFMIPWRGLTLIGTTDTDYEGNPADAHADRSDVDYLIEGTNRLLPRLRLEKAGVITTFAGVRPLAAQEKKDPWAVSRTHLIHEDANGLISVVGGKFTTFRRTAQDLVDRAAALFPEKSLKPCRTGKTFFGYRSEDWRGDRINGLMKELLSQGILYPPQVSRLVQRYGLQAEPIFQWILSDREMAQPVCPHHMTLCAEVRFAMQHEMAVSLSDLLWRRFQLGWSSCQGLDALGQIAKVAARCAGWSDAQAKEQVDRYRQEVLLQHRYER